MSELIIILNHEDEKKRRKKSMMPHDGGDDCYTNGSIYTAYLSSIKTHNDLEK
jgi:hypothetical protein